MRRPFSSWLSLQIDLVIHELETTRPNPARRDLLRRRKAFLERSVPARRPRR